MHVCARVCTCVYVCVCGRAISVWRNRKFRICISTISQAALLPRKEGQITRGLTRRKGLMAWLCPRAASGPWASAFFSSRRGPNTCLEETKWGEVLAQESAESCRGCMSWSPLSQATSERDRKVTLKGADDRGRGGLGQHGGSGPRSWSLRVQSSRQGELGASGGGAGSVIAFTAQERGLGP